MSLLANRLRNYQVTATGVCFRTEVAACIKYMARGDWEDYVLGNSTEGLYTEKTAAVIQGWLRVYIKEADVTVAALESKGYHGDTQKAEILLKRWRQIRRFCEQAMAAVVE